jgi:spore coat protein A, manganese oxidase
MMGISRRRFIQGGAAGAAVVSFGNFVWAFGQSPLNVRKFIQPLRGLGAAPAIPVASPTVSKPGQYDLYQLSIVESRFSFHPDITGEGPGTKVWGYGTTDAKGNDLTPAYLGGVIVAQEGQPVRLRFSNKLADPKNPDNGLAHPLPVDPTLTEPPPAGLLPSERNVPGANQHNRTAVHPHGAFLDWTSDGGPFDWFTPNGHYGPSVDANSPFRKDANGNLLANNQIEI